MPHRRTFLHTNTHKQASTYKHTYSKDKKLPDLTQGAVFGKLLLFCLPLMFTNLLQVLYNAADMMVVSLSNEPNAVGAVGTTGAFVNLVVNLFIGFATGANVVVARCIGARDKEGISKATHTAVVMSVIFGVLGGVVGFWAAEPMLALMGAEESLLELATIYTRIYFIGLPFISVTNYLIAIFRAKGDTKTPLYVLSFSGLVNVVFNFIFVVACGMSVEGVALATVISNLVSAVWLLWLLMKDEGDCRLSLRALCLEKKAFRDILYVGLPAGIQGSLFSISNILMQSSVIQINNTLCPPGSAYDAVLTGHSAANNLEAFAYTVQNAVYQGAITFTSQNVGAGKPRRVYRIMLCCYLLGMAVAMAVAVPVFCAREALLALYGVRDAAQGTLEHIAFHTAELRMLYMQLPYFALSLMEMGGGILRGLGKSVTSAVISLIGACGLRIVWLATVFRAYPSLETVYISYPITWLITGLTSFVCALVILRKMVRSRKGVEP